MSTHARIQHNSHNRFYFLSSTQISKNQNSDPPWAMETFYDCSNFKQKYTNHWKYKSISFVSILYIFNVIEREMMWRSGKNFFEICYFCRVVPWYLQWTCLPCEFQSPRNEQQKQYNHSQFKKQCRQKHNFLWCHFKVALAREKKWEIVKNECSFFLV